MLPSKQAFSLYVDKTSHHWIVRDTDGNFWMLPSVDDAWDHRQQVDPTTEVMDLEPVPGHYKAMFGVPR
jgi:hypothetical protein